MTRLAVFFASIALGGVLLTGLDWWVDPFGDQYRGDLVAEAMQHVPPCDVSTAVLGDRTWPAFKLDVIRRRRATTIVTGTSRVWQLGARFPGERFANAQLPGMSPDSVPILFERLAQIRPGTRFTVYVGVEPFWFSVPTRSSSFAPTSSVDRLRFLTSAETFRATLDDLAHHPTRLFDPLSRSRPELEQMPGGCLLDEGNAVASGSANAWSMDGTFVYAYELTGRSPGHEDFLHGPEGRAMFGTSLAAEPLQRMREALAFARAHRWRIVGFTSPFSHDTIVRVRRVAAGRTLLRLYDKAMPRLFSDYGYPYLNLEDAPTVPCTDAQFQRRDGAHMDPTCARRVRRLLDAAAGS